MTKPKVSVIVATRGRVRQLEKMLLTLRHTAFAPEDVEVVLRCDADDPETVMFLRSQPHLFIVGPQRSGYATLASLVNEAARLSHADLAIVVNDDAEFMTKDWDLRLVQEASRFPDGIFDLGVTDVLNNDNFVWPCTSRRVIDLIGIHDERLVYSDIWLRDVMLRFDRAVRVHDVVIKHNWAGPSASQDEARRREDPALHGRCVEEAVNKIKEALSWG